MCSHVIFTLSNSISTSLQVYTSFLHYIVLVDVRICFSSVSTAQTSINTRGIAHSDSDHRYTWHATKGKYRYHSYSARRMSPSNINMSTIEVATPSGLDTAPNSAPPARSTRGQHSASVSFHGKVNVASTYGDEEYDRTIPMRRNYSALELSTIVHELRWYKKTSMPVHPNSLSKRSSSGLAAVDDSKHLSRAQISSVNILAATTIFHEDICTAEMCDHDKCHSNDDAIACT